jgi:DNA polymerase-1
MNENSGLSDVRLHLVDSVEKANEFISWLGERRPHNAVSVDIETGELPGNPRKDALSPWHGRIRLVQVGDGMQGWALPWDFWKGVFYQGMKDYDGPIICHNIAFEARWFAVQSDWELPWHQAHDTMIMAHLMDPLGSGALKRLAALHIDNRSVALQGPLDTSLAENGWTWGTVPVNFEPYWAYGALDTVLTTRLWEKYYPTMFAPGAMYSIPYELEMATRRICTRMEVNGARVDLEYSQKKLEELSEYSNSVKKWVSDNYKGASSGSNIQLVRVFEDQLGENITATTPSGQKSMTKEQLQLFTRDGSPEAQQLADLILKQRKADKLATSYFSNFINDNVNGYVHPSIRTLGARTGRMSITDPALQTLPSGDATVRRAFVPKDDEHFIISSDLDQVEFRLTANLSQDPSLIRLFHEADASGGDVFTSIMRDVYADQTLEKSDARRKLIKGVVYGKLYGAGVDKMALTAKVATEQMKAVVDAFDASYPGVKQLQLQIENAGTERLRNEGQGYVKTRTGRRLPCDDDRVYSLTNYLIQSTAAEIFKQNLVKLDQADLTEHLIVPVHDEIVLQANKDEMRDVMATVQECMTTRDGWDIPLTAGVDGPFRTWGDKYATGDENDSVRPSD